MINLGIFGRCRIPGMLLFSIILLISMNLPLYGQEQILKIDKATRAEVIDSVLNAFMIHYVYPDTAREFNKVIRNNFKNGEYDDIEDLRGLVNRLTEDLMGVSGDQHIRVSVMSPDDFNPAVGDTVTWDKIERRARENFNFRKVEWLPGNVGYIRFDLFDDPAYAGPTAVAAMNFLENCDAIIIDLRNNHGGEEKMVKLLASYFFKEPTLINSLYFTENDSLRQSWTYAYVPGKKMIDTDLYILTSNNTASGAEAFTYGLQNLGRAVVVGETTAGAAHWAEYYDLPGLRVRVKIPIARPINPVTNTSWEKTGVKPDIEIPAGDALKVTYIETLGKMQEKEPDEKLKGDLEWHLIKAKAQLDPVILSQDDILKYTGTYGRYAILVKQGQLYWRYADGTDYILIPMTSDLFGFDDTEDIRLKIERKSDGEIDGFRLLYRDGSEGKLRPRSGEPPE